MNRLLTPARVLIPALFLVALLAACSGAAPVATEGVEPPAAAADSVTEAPAEAAAVAAPAEVAEGSASALAPAERNGMFPEAPAMTIDPTKFYYATLKTERGDIRVQLFADRAPVTVNNFVFLAREGFYNDTTFHRVLEAFMAQAGDPTGTGSGGPGYQFADEFYPGGDFDRPYLLAMANAGPATNGSQFFITFIPTDWLNGLHTIFGEVIAGQEVVDSLTLRDPNSGTTEPGDTLFTVLIEESSSSELPTPTPLPPPTATPTPFAPTGDAADRPLAAIPAAEKAGYFNTAPEMSIDPTKRYTATVTTSAGELTVSLFADLAPVAVNNFVVLANLGFYDGLPINQVDPTQLLVVGSPNNDPSSDAGYTIPAELSVPVSLTVGSLAYIPAGASPEGTPLSSSSQLIVALIAPPQEVGVDFSFFGQVTGGLDVLSKLAMTDTITSIIIEEE